MIYKHRKWNQSRQAVVYSDVDGTLVSKSNQISPILIRQIEHFIAMGFGFTFATGRSFSGAKRLLQHIPVNSPVVLCNGAFVYDPERDRSWWRAIHLPVALQIYQQLYNFPGVWVYADRVDHSLLVSQADALEDSFILQEGLHACMFTNWNDLMDGADILKIGIKIIDCKQTIHEQLQNKLSKIIGQFSQYITCCKSSDNYIEIIPHGVSKWSGILMSQKMRGCRDHMLYAIGDHYNDLEMIQYADVGIAMENAVPEIKQAASYTAGHVNNLAMIDVLQEIMEQMQPVIRSNEA